VTYPNSLSFCDNRLFDTSDTRNLSLDPTSRLTLLTNANHFVDMYFLFLFLTSVLILQLAEILELSRTIRMLSCWGPKHVLVIIIGRPNLPRLYAVLTTCNPNPRICTLTNAEILLTDGTSPSSAFVFVQYTALLFLFFTYIIFFFFHTKLSLLFCNEKPQQDKFSLHLLIFSLFSINIFLTLY
jgi:hypothetical protein